MSRILVVEDDKFFREAIKDLLSRKRHEVFEAPDGKVAREVLSVQDFDMVLTDVQMPGLSGVKPTAKFRSMNSSRVPKRILMFTCVSPIKST